MRGADVGRGRFVLLRQPLHARNELLRLILKMVIDTDERRDELILALNVHMRVAAVRALRDIEDRIRELAVRLYGVEIARAYGCGDMHELVQGGLPQVRRMRLRELRDADNGAPGPHVGDVVGRLVGFARLPAHAVGSLQAAQECVQLDAKDLRVDVRRRKARTPDAVDREDDALSGAILGHCSAYSPLNGILPASFRPGQNVPIAGTLAKKVNSHCKTVA